MLFPIPCPLVLLYELSPMMWTKLEALSTKGFEWTFSSCRYRAGGDRGHFEYLVAICTPFESMNIAIIFIQMNHTMPVPVGHDRPVRR